MTDPKGIVEPEGSGGPSSLCLERHPMDRHAKLLCQLDLGHAGEHIATTFDGYYRLHWSLNLPREKK